MDGYSRLVAVLKVALPLTALGLLSTLFLLSRSVDPTTTLPFGEAEISERLREGLVSEPYFSGITSSGDQIVVTATSAKPAGEGQLARAEDLSAHMTLSRGGVVSVKSRSGSFDQTADIVRFIGEVLVETTSGYRLNTDVLESGFKSLHVQSEGVVHGDGPFGRLEAGRMTLRSGTESQNAHLHFTDGVKLIYDPYAKEENR